MAPPPSVSPSGRPRPSVWVTGRSWPPPLSYTQPGMTDCTTAAPAGWRTGACGIPSSPLESAAEEANLGSERSINTATRRASPRLTLNTMSTASEVREQSYVWWESWFIYCVQLCSALFYEPVVPNLGIRAPPWGRKINLRGHKIITGIQTFLFLLFWNLNFFLMKY